MALAYAASLGNAQTIYDDLPVSTINNVRLTQPANVAIVSTGSPFEGANGTISTNLPGINFIGTSAGLLMMPASSLKGLNLFGANSGANADHILEFAGQVALSEVRCYAGPNCGLVTKTITPTVNSSLSSVQIQLPGSGLTNNTYPNVAFTGGGGTGATMTIVVSGGAITSATYSTGGTGYTNDNLVSLAANALYSGSPAMTNFAQISTAQMGHSRFRSVFLIGGTALVKGLQIGGAFSFVDVNDYEVFAPSAPSTSVGLEVTRVDGLKVDGYKVFGIGGTAFLGDQPAADTAHSFWIFANSEIDGVNVGFNITAPIQQLSFHGGFTRSSGKSIVLNNPFIGATVGTMNLLSQADITLQAVDFNTFTLNNVSFTSDTTYDTAPFPYIAISGGTGLGSYYVGGNTSDGKHPFFNADAAAKGGTVGPNNWPGRKYAAVSGGNPTPGYATSPNFGANIILPTTNGRASITTDANGLATIPYNLGYTSWAPEAHLLGAATGTNVNIVSVGTESFVVRVTGSTGAVVASTGFTVIWRA